MKRLTIGALVTASALTAGLAGAAEIAQASPASEPVTWHTAWTGPRDGVLESVTAPARDSAWAVGWVRHRPLLVHWNGRGWREVTFPVKGYTPYAIAASAANDVWMFGVTANETAEALSWNGAAWIKVAEPDIGGEALSGVAVLGPADVWIATQTAAYHDLGGIWSKVRLPSNFVMWAGGQLGQLAGTSDRNMWVAGTLTTSQGYQILAAYRWSVDRWRRVRIPRTPSYTAEIQVDSRRNVVIVTPHKVLHWNGARWTAMANQNSPAVGPLAPFGPHGFWIGAYSLWTGSTWLTVLPMSSGYPAFSNGLAQIPGTHQSWMAGDTHLGAVIMRSSG